MDRAVTPPRTFIPHFDSAWRGPFDPATLIYYDQNAQVSRIFYSTPQRSLHLIRGNKLAIVIDGSCHTNGTSRARASWGVYFGPCSRYNLMGLVSDAFAQTIHVAELSAAFQALLLVHNILQQGNTPITEIILLTNSDYLIKSMSEWVYGWVRNGWVGENGEPVANRGLFESLHNWIDNIVREYGKPVRFWKVDRVSVQEAERLANAALG
ncbi:ribonuclease H-like domain-containing protein [Kalaharituber pfeilii]|nr:ribonuclease H-like domain-containing protein [Kalaharituber pfeilii]